MSPSFKGVERKVEIKETLPDGLYVSVCLYVLIPQSCPTLCDAKDCSPPASLVHEISQARILEWAAIPFCRGSSQPRDRIQVSCIAGKYSFPSESPGKPSSLCTVCESLSQAPLLRVRVWC